MTLIERRIATIDDALRTSLVLLGLACGTLLVLAFTAPTGSRAAHIAMIVVGICLLVLGLQLPMIDIEARIEEFELVLLGEPVRFSDQVLFHQSKSILQVVHVLIQERKPELMLVAAAVFAFSVVLPTVKMVLSGATLMRGSEYQSGFIRFLVHRSGKWSMADVMVVAIFMAFIGFTVVCSSTSYWMSGLTTIAKLVTSCVSLKPERSR